MDNRAHSGKSMNVGEVGTMVRNSRRRRGGATRATLLRSTAKDHVSVRALNGLEHLDLAEKSAVVAPARGGFEKHCRFPADLLSVGGNR
jgi:hypothetical protein